MSDLTLIKWTGKKNKFVNSVPLGTPVFIYGKVLNPLTHADLKKSLEDIDEANEFFIKRQLNLDEEEQFYEDTNLYLDGIGKKNADSITSKRILEIIEVNKRIIEFLLENLHHLYWRDFKEGVISVINPNKALSLILPAVIDFRKILITYVDLKYNRGLSVANVKNIKEDHDLDTRQRLGENVPKIKK